MMCKSRLTLKQKPILLWPCLQIYIYRILLLVTVLVFFKHSHIERLLVLSANDRSSRNTPHQSQLPVDMVVLWHATACLFSWLNTSLVLYHFY